MTSTATPATGGVTTGPKNTLPVCSRPSTRSPVHGIVSKPIPAEFGVEGFFFRYERHFVYWRHLSNGDIGVVTILHERMHRIDRFREDFGSTERPVADGRRICAGFRARHAEFYTGTRESSLPELSSPPPALDNCFSTCGCGRIFFLFSRVIKVELFTLVV